MFYSKLFVCLFGIINFSIKLVYHDLESVFKLFVFLCISQNFCILALLIFAYLHIKISIIYTFSNSVSLISTFFIILFFIFYVFNVVYRFFISTFYRSFMTMYLFFVFFSEFLNFLFRF